MTKIRVADRVEIKDHRGKAWEWAGQFGTVTEMDDHCLTVHRESGRTERDVREHYRRTPESAARRG